MAELIEIRNLQVTHAPKKAPARELVKGIDLSVGKGRIVGIIGESGSGKSMAMKALMGLLPEAVHAANSSYLFEGQPVRNPAKLPISMIFQDPMTSLDPVRTVGYHLREVIRRKQKTTTAECDRLAVQQLEKVGIPQPEQRLKQYPHELSGGMRQRVMIAMALLTDARVLIADEPTTALDVTVQAQILALIQQLQAENQLTVILVSHDFGVVAGMCDEVHVMLEGRFVESGSTADIFYHPQHPYTKKLLQAAAFVEEPQGGGDL